MQLSSLLGLRPVRMMRVGNREACLLLERFDRSRRGLRERGMMISRSLPKPHTC
jgi:hypothetical protein